jgi:methylenetetrahydrofolate dehydrogenase (NADP+)/methenyltetrahydrofolate cyclohydrolase
MAKLLLGKPVATYLDNITRQKIEALKAKNIYPTLAILRVGSKSSDLAYEAGIKKKCSALGVAVKEFAFPTDCSMDEILKTVRLINQDKGISGCLVLRPLPPSMNEHVIALTLAPEKDVDCMTDASLTGVFTGKGVGFPPCTAQACMEILNYYGYNLQGKKVNVIGRSLVIGKPVAMMLLAKNATVTICHSKTENLPLLCRDADMLIAAVGRMHMVNKEFVRKGQVLIDVGINVDDQGKLHGDVDLEDVESVVEAVTPVPGGVGSVTTSVLMRHVVDAAEKMAGPDL